MPKRRLQKIRHQSADDIQIDNINEQQQQQQQIDVDRNNNIMAIDEKEQYNNRELIMKYHLLGKTDLGNKTLRNNTDTVEDTTVVEGGEEEDNSDFNNGVGHEEFRVHILNNNNDVGDGEEESAEWDNDTNVIIDIGEGNSEESIQERAYTDGNTANDQFSVFILDTSPPTTSSPTTTLPPTLSPTITGSPSIITPPTTSPTTHLQSLHKTLKNYADHLKQLEKLHAGDILHDKSSFNGVQNGGAHKNAENREENRPIRWTPPEDSEEGIQEAPRAPNSNDDEYDSSGKINCKSSNGQYGNRIGGVVVRYQYEITFEKRVLNNSEGLNGILPGVEHGMSDLLLPIFFHEECLRIDHDDDGNDNVGTTGRELMTLSIQEGEGMDEVEKVWEEFGGVVLSPSSPPLSEEGGRGLLRGQHRRLNKVVGVDSAPRDFPLADKDCEFYLPTKDSACRVMEGALTIYFPPNYSIETLVSGAQLSTLNAIREGMEYGGLVRMADPRIMKLKLLDSSYSLRPIIPPPVDVMDDTANGGDSASSSDSGGIPLGLIVGAAIPLVLICCCCCCFLNFKRNGGKTDDIYQMLLPIIDPKKARALEEARIAEAQAALDKSIKKEKKKSKKKKQKKKDKKKKKKENLDPFAEQLIEDLQSGAVGEDEASDEDDSKSRKSRKKKKDRKKKKAKADKELRAQSNRNLRGSTRSSASSSQLLRMSNRSSIKTASTGTDTEGTTSGDGTTSSSDDDGSTTIDTSKNTTSMGSDDDGTTTSTSDGDGTTSTSESNDSTTSSDEDSDEAEDHFDFEPNFHETFINQRRNVRQRQKMRSAPGRPKPSKPQTNTNSNMIMMGHVAGADDDDNCSVMTGMTGATGVSAATQQVSNKARGRGGPRFGGGDDDVSVMTGISAATRPAGNLGGGRNRNRYGGGGGDDVSVMTGISAATKPAGNLGGGGDDVSVMTGISAATRPAGNLASGRVRFGGRGGAGGGDDASVMSDAYSMMSAATRPAGNMGGGVGDDVSVMTGMSAATRPAGNLGGGRNRNRYGGGGDDVSVMTGISAATKPAGNLGGGGDDVSVMTGMSAATRPAGNLGGGRRPATGNLGRLPKPRTRTGGAASVASGHSSGSRDESLNSKNSKNSKQSKTDSHGGRSRNSSGQNSTGTGQNSTGQNSRNSAAGRSAASGLSRTSGTDRSAAGPRRKPSSASAAGAPSLRGSSSSRSNLSSSVRSNNLNSSTRSNTLQLNKISSGGSVSGGRSGGRGSGGSVSGGASVGSAKSGTGQGTILRFE